MPRVFLTDFGLARDITTGSRLTRSGTTLGTPAYMSPEQARGEVGALTPASDVWALGCVLYEMLSGGTRAFDGETPAAVIGAVLTGTPMRLGAVPESARTLSMVCLQRDPGARYQTAGALRDDARNALAGRSLSRRPPSAPRGWWPLAVGAAVLVLGIVGIWAARRDAPRPPSASPNVAAADTATVLAERGWGRRRTDLSEAVTLLERALTLAPERQDWRLRLGLLHWARGDDAAAERTWAGVRDTDPVATRAWWLRGLAAEARATTERRSEDWVAARRAWGRAAAGAGAESRWARAGLAFLDRQLGTARDLLGDDRSWEVAFLRGLIATSDGAGDATAWTPGQSDKGRTAEAEERAYTQVLDEGLPFLPALVNRGNARVELGHWEGAIADFEAAIAMRPHLLPALYGRARAKERAGDLPGAVAACDAALAVNARFHPALVLRGDIRGLQGDLTGALADFDAALAIQPEDGYALINRGRWRRDAGDLRGALADYDAAVGLAPTAVEAFYGRAKVKKLLGDRAGAIADYDAALVIAPTYAEALTNRGNLRRQARDYAGALADYEAALRAKPGLLQALVGRANALQGLGDFPAAMAAYAEALQAYPDEPNALANRGLAQLRQGNPAAALTDLARALQVAPPDWAARAWAEKLQRTARARLAAPGSGED